MVVPVIGLVVVPVSGVVVVPNGVVVVVTSSQQINKTNEVTNSNVIYIESKSSTENKNSVYLTAHFNANSH